MRTITFRSFDSNANKFVAVNFPVDATVTQCTELTDKSGTLIYEGDIVEYYKGAAGLVRATVIFDSGMFCLKHTDGYINRYPLNPGNYLVVGNIFQPDPLER